jgi:hypothetical protein
MQTATPDWRSDSLWQKQPAFLHVPISNSHLSPWLNFISPMAFANLKTLELKFSAEPQHCHHRPGALEERRGCAQRIKTNIIQTARTFASLATRCQLRELTLEFPVGLIQVLIYHGEIEDLEGMCSDIIRLVTVLRAIATIRGLKVLRLSKLVPQLSPQYFNRTMRVPIVLPRLSPRSLQLNVAIAYLQHELDTACSTIVDMFSTTTLVGIAPYPDVETYKENAIRIRGHTLDEPELYATDPQPKRYQTPMSKLFAAGVNHIVTEYNLHAQENIKSQDYHVRKARIIKAKFDFIVGFRTELQELGIVEDT